MTEEKLVPELRFPEFSGEWEEKRLGEVSDVRDGTHDSPKYTDSGNKFITSKNLLPNGKIDFENISYISDDDFNIVNKRSKVDIGDILFGMIGTIGNPIIVNRDDFAIKNVALIKEKKILLNKYLVYFLNSEYIYKKFYILNTGGSQKFVGLGIIRNLNILTPSIEEQEKIGRFLYKIDKKLTLQREKIEGLENYKKAMMQRIFDQEIRFKDENGEDYPEWKEKKLGEIGEIITGETPKSKNTNHFGDKYLWVTPGDIKSNRYIMKTDRMLSEKGFNSIRKINKNSVMATCIGSTIGKLAMSSEIMATNQQINSLECNDENNPEFIYYNLIYNNNLFHKYASTQAVPLINKSTFSNIEINVGCIEEQEKIASFLSSIDNKINLEEERLEEYKKFKKGLMQRIFI